MTRADPPIMSEVPEPGLSPLELCRDLLKRIEAANRYTRKRKRFFKSRSTIVWVSSFLLSGASTIILGLSVLPPLAQVGFVLVALVTVVNTVEPFFAWRSRWVLMEETQYRFYRLRDDLTFYLASTPPDELDERRIAELFDRYQDNWDRLSTRWLEYRRAPSGGG